MMIQSLLFLILLNFSPQEIQKPAKVEPDPEKLVDVRKLMELTGSKKLGEQVLNQMFLQLKNQLPKVPEKFWQDLRQSLNINEMLESMVPVHAKYFTHEEVKELIRFYESPVGRKLTEATPKISEESMVEGQKWVLKTGQMIEKKLEEAGYR
jgi:hypothetical protein